MKKVKFITTSLILVAFVALIGTGCAPLGGQEQPMMNEQQAPTTGGGATEQPGGTQPGGTTQQSGTQQPGTQQGGGTTGQ